MNIKLVMLLWLICGILNAQPISFDASISLIGHPDTDSPGFGYPFIPLDYNGDGHTDFIGSTFDDQLLYKGLGEGTFDTLDIYQGFAQDPLKIMDFDKDGDMDVIMARYFNLYESADSFIFINPNINFQETIIEVGDFNKDGFNDLVTHKNVTFGDDEIIIHLNDGDNTSFTAITVYDDGNYGDVELGDIDNDDDIDILILFRFGANDGVILFNDGSSQFTVKPLENVLDLSGFTAKLVDLDADEDLDLVAQGDEDNIYLIKNTDNFQTLFDYEEVFIQDIIFFDLADLNNDGFLDIVSVSTRNDDFEIRQTRSTGSFQYNFPGLIKTFPSPGSFGYPNFNYLTNNLSIYDYDSDGKLDILYIDGFSDTPEIVFLKNTSDIMSNTENNDLKSFVQAHTYPNPAMEKIQFSNLSLDQRSNPYLIRSSTGQLVKQGQLEAGSIDIKELRTGIYQVEIYDRKKPSLRLISKFIKTE